MALALLLTSAAASTPDTNTLFLWEALLDAVGVLAAIWTLWIFAWLPLKGVAMSAFRLIAVGGVVFAFLHVVDTLFSAWGALPSGLPFLIHWGLVLISMVYFVFGLARLADAVSAWQVADEYASTQRWWPLAVVLALLLLAVSFMIYGFRLETIFWAVMALNVGIVVLAIACAFQVWRAHLGGAGRLCRCCIVWPLFRPFCFLAPVWRAFRGRCRDRCLRACPRQLAGEYDGRALVLGSGLVGK